MKPASVWESSTKRRASEEIDETRGGGHCVRKYGEARYSSPIRSPCERLYSGAKNQGSSKKRPSNYPDR